VALWLQARCSTMFLKLNKMKKEYLLETYNQAATPALQKIRSPPSDLRSILLEEHSKLSEQYNTATKKLHDYLNVGPDFEGLTSEYAALLAEIRNKEWALSQLS
jgi:hypothetical protein